MTSTLPEACAGVSAVRLVESWNATLVAARPSNVTVAPGWLPAVTASPSFYVVAAIDP